MVKEMGIVKYRRAFFGALSSHSSIDSIVNEETYIKLFVIIFVLFNVVKKFKNHLRLAGFRTEERTDSPRALPGWDGGGYSAGVAALGDRAALPDDGAGTACRR